MPALEKTVPYASSIEVATTRLSMASQHVIGASTRSRMIASSTLTTTSFGQRSRSSMKTRRRISRRTPCSSSIKWVVRRKS